jgi:hypothetical protein
MAVAAVSWMRQGERRDDFLGLNVFDIVIDYAVGNETTPLEAEMIRKIIVVFLAQVRKT